MQKGREISDMELFCILVAVVIAQLHLSKLLNLYIENHGDFYYV